MNNSECKNLKAATVSATVGSSYAAQPGFPEVL